MTKQTAGFLALAFGAGVVSGMFAQRLIKPAPALEPVDKRLVSASPYEPLHGEDLAQHRREIRESRDNSPSIFESGFDSAAAAESAREEHSMLGALPADASHAPHDGEDSSRPRAAWTNRESWLAQRLAEREARITRMRSNLIEQARLNDQQALRFEVLIAAMNLRLKEQARLWREAIDSGAMTPHEARARAMKEIGSAVSLTYDELDRNMPPNWRAATTNESINLWTFIEPELWRDLRPLMGRGRPPLPPAGR